MFGNAFKSRPNYVFDYKPRYYDARKERLEKLKKKYQTDNKETEDNVVMSLTRDNLKADWNRNKHLAHDKRANIRIALIIALLVGIFAYILELHKLF